MITHEYARAHEIVGRSAEIEVLRNTLSGSAVRGVVITGSPGVGKTALANRIVEIAKAGALANRFDQHVWVTAYRQPWSNVMTQLGQALLGRDIVLKATIPELQERIITICSQRRLLVVVDNVEPNQHADASDLFSAWVAAKHQSVLVMTSVEFVPEFGPASKHVPISGLDGEYPVLELLGDGLKQRFGANALLSIVAPLRGIPLNLLYLQWRDPADTETLSEVVQGLEHGTLDRRTAVEDVLTSVTRTPAPFMALGIVRRLQFDESLLAFLWDRMGGGSSEAYVTMRNRLVATRLLIPVQNEPGTYRVAEDIHKQLYRALCARIGEERTATAHFFAAEYYRRQYEDIGKVEDLQSYLYHCRECGEEQWAYAFVFETDVIRRLQRAGMAVQLHELMDGFLALESKYSPFRRARICLAMAAACNDLSDFEACLSYVMKADDALNVETVIHDPKAAMLRRQTAYYSAVAYSNTGRSVECVRSYYQVIAGSSTRGDQLGCLAVAYLGHELKYHDMRLSVRYGQEALELARADHDYTTTARVLCSLAETEIFIRETGSAESHFTEARAYCVDSDDKPTDARELGRVLKNWGLLHLATGDIDGAFAKLGAARELSVRVGDRRRIASGDLYAAIATYGRGLHSDGVNQLKGSIVELNRLKDGRYLVPALMTLAHWLVASFDGQRKSLRSLLELVVDTNTREATSGVGDAIYRVINDQRFDIYSAFWRDHFRPLVVSPTST